MDTQSKSLLSVAPLFLVLFIDSMGLGLLFPILSTMLIDRQSTFLVGDYSDQMRQFLYAITVSIFMLCWFFGAAFLGDLSDKTGRRKSLLICLFGACFGYFISAIAVPLSSLTLLILGRVIAGFTAGSQPIAQAAIVDVSTEEHKARNIGYILLAVSLGFVAGPIFGGVLSDAKLSPYFNFSTPLYFASIISLINAFLLWFFFKETFHKTEKVKLKLHRAIEIFVSAFQHKKVWKLSIVFLVMIFGWSCFFSFVPMNMYYRFHFETVGNSAYMGAMGLGFSIGCGYLVDVLTKRFDKKPIVIVTALLAALTVFLTALQAKLSVIFVLAFFTGISMACAYSVILVLFSDLVSSEEQGWVMGVTGSIMALSFGITSLGIGSIAHYNPELPIYIASVGLALSGILLGFL